MRYRREDADGDYVFGFDQGEFLVDSVQAVQQLIITRLGLYVGEWFLDLSDGLPLAGKILGYNTAKTRDLAIKARILNTQGVLNIESYSSNFDGTTRKFSVNCRVNTVFGAVTVSLPL